MPDLIYALSCIDIYNKNSNRISSHSRAVDRRDRNNVVGVWNTVNNTNRVCEGRFTVFNRRHASSNRGAFYDTIDYRDFSVIYSFSSNANRSPLLVVTIFSATLRVCPGTLLCFASLWEGRLMKSLACCTRHNPLIVVGIHQKSRGLDLIE